MAAQAVQEPSGRVEGATTKAAKSGALAGGGLGGGGGAALANIIVFFAGELGADWSPIEGALTVLFALIGGALAAQVWAGKKGRETPTDQVRTTKELIPVVEGPESARAVAAAEFMSTAGGSTAVESDPESSGDPVQDELFDPTTIPAADLDTVGVRVVRPDEMEGRHRAE